VMGKTAVVPEAPIILTAVPGAAAGSITITWSVPPDGGSPITGYTIQRRRSNTGSLNCTDSAWGSPQTVTSSPYTYTNLSNTRVYCFQVLAMNVIGSGPYSATSGPIVPN
jgi:hypothetical protein